MARIRLSKKARNILAIILSVLIGIGAIFGFVAITKELSSKTKTIHPAFSIGGLDDETGKYVETDDTLYTKDLIECQGLVIEPKFDKDVTFQVFYYNYEGVYLDATKEKNEKYVRGHAFQLAKYCRIVIYPDMQEKTPDDFHLYFWDIAGYADDFTVTVNKEQNFTPVDLYSSLFENRVDSDFTEYDLDDGYSYYPHMHFGESIYPTPTFSSTITKNDEVYFDIIKIELSYNSSIQIINPNNYELSFKVYYFDYSGRQQGYSPRVLPAGASELVYGKSQIGHICLEIKGVEISAGYWTTGPLVIYQYK